MKRIYFHACKQIIISLLLILVLIMGSCSNNSIDTKLIDNKSDEDDIILRIDNFDSFYAIALPNYKNISTEGAITFTNGPLFGIKPDGAYEPLVAKSEKGTITNISPRHVYYDNNMLFFTDGFGGGYNNTIFVNTDKKNILDLSTGYIYKTDKNIEFIYANPFTNSCFYVGFEENQDGVYLMTFEDEKLVSTYLYDCGSYGFAEEGPNFLCDRYNNVLQVSDRNQNHYLINKEGYILDLNEEIELNNDYGVFIKQGKYFFSKDGQWEDIKKLKLCLPIMFEYDENQESFFKSKMSWKNDGYDEKSDSTFSKIEYEITKDNVLNQIKKTITITSEEPFKYITEENSVPLITLPNYYKSPIYINGFCYFYDINDFTIKSLDIDTKEIKNLDSLDDKQYLLSEGVVLEALYSDYFSVSLKDRRLNSVIRLYDKNGRVNTIDERKNILTGFFPIYTLCKIPNKQTK